MTDLGTLPGMSISYAQGINDKGQIAGFNTGNDHIATLWTLDNTTTDTSVP